MNNRIRQYLNATELPPTVRGRLEFLARIVGDGAWMTDADREKAVEVFRTVLAAA